MRVWQYVLLSSVLLVVLKGSGLTQVTIADLEKTESKEDKKRATNNRHAQVHRVAESMTFYRLNEGKREAVKLVERPVLRYVDTPRTDKDGAVWVVGDKGRPLAMMVVYTKSSFPNGRWIQAVTSLSSSNSLVGTTHDGTNWSPLKPGVTMKPFPKSPEPAANPSRRLRQMKALVRRFSGHEFWPANSRHELRLLVQPLYRYTEPQSGILDGAIFALAHDTNPEVFVLIEARKNASRTEWKFGIARFGFAELHVKIDSEQVWTRHLISSTRPTEPYWLFHLAL